MTHYPMSKVNAATVNFMTKAPGGKKQSAPESLPKWYWPAVTGIVLCAILAGFLLPYKKYSLDFGSYGRRAIRVQRFSGAQEIWLADQWQPLSGQPLPATDVQQIKVTASSGADSKHQTISLHIVNPTRWHIKKLIVPSSVLINNSNESVVMVECDIAPFAMAEILVVSDVKLDGQQVGTVEASGKY